MKTEIEFKYKPDNGYHIQKFIICKDGSIAILNSKYRNTSIIDIVGKRKIDLSIYKSLSLGSSYKSFFKYKNGFGIIEYTNTIILWESVYSRPQIINIKNPFLPDKHNRKHYTILASYIEESNELFFGIEDITYYGAPARYWCKLKLKEKSYFGLKSKEFATWDQLNHLKLNYYPPTWNHKYPEREWLNILDLKANSNSLLIHTNGGTLTRLKSGKLYEFSIITRLNHNNELIKNFDIEEGRGLFSLNGKYFILHPRQKKNKLYFYNTNDFNLTFDISLTPKQNLGEEKKNYILADVFENKIVLSNAHFLNICKMINNESLTQK